MDRQNTFFEGMKRTGHAWEESRKARLENAESLKRPADTTAKSTAHGLPRTPKSLSLSATEQAKRIRHGQAALNTTQKSLNSATSFGRTR